MVQDGVAEDEVEALVVERQPLGVGGDGLDLEAERARRCARSVVEHPRRDVGGGRVARSTPELQQVEREVAGARADLERVAEAVGRSPPSALRSLPQHLRAGRSAPKSMPHLASYSAAAASW